MYRSFIGSPVLILLVCMFGGTGVMVKSLSAALPENLDDILEEINNQYDGHWGIGVMELNTEESETVDGNRQFQIESPLLPMTSYGIEMSNNGVLSLDSLIARNEQLWEKLHWSQQGGRGTCQAVLYVMGKQRINDWIEQKDFSGTVVNGVQLFFPDCPQVDPNYITAIDGLGFLKIIYDNLEKPYVANLGTNPPLSDHIRETLGLWNNIYGWIDDTEDWRHLFIIVDRPLDSDLGIVVLAEGIEDPQDVDSVFRIIYEALTD
ncbi:MAG: hypothetical protein K8S15_03425 [Candidatus Aegiribacteria sp.]|nr:hypothetical protein [Candidatus Aegiribacteria sp.]